MEAKLEEIISQITQQTGKTKEEIDELIQTKIKKFEGLLTEQGALFMVQKELGLKQESIESKIGELNDGMKDVEVKGEIKTIYPIKEFEKNGKKGRVGSFLLEDDTGIVRVTLWNDQIDKCDLSIGSEVAVKNAFISSYNNKKQISLGFNGTIEMLNKKEEIFTKMNDLKAGLNAVNVTGRITRKFPCKEFNTGERQGKLCSFQFGDETSLLRATAWNDKAEEMGNFRENDIIQIKNAYTKEGMFGIELHLGYNAIVNKSEKDLPSTREILKEEIPEKKINQINENENVIISGKVKELQQGPLFFLACEKCGKKVSGEEKKICEKCGEVEGEKRAIMNFFIEDDSGEIRTTFFGDTALKIIGLNKDEFDKETNEKSSEKIVEEINEKLKGNKVKLFGYAKENSYNGETEFNVKDIIE
jgi:replication factor A1